MSDPSQTPVVLLSGGNPQIAKGYGPAPVAAWIAALSGWKHDLAAEVDGLVMQAAPGALKAVKWNSPLYGMTADHYFLSLHYMTRYLKVAFLQGAQLSPLPPVTSKDPQVRYLHLGEALDFDRAQFADWIAQAAAHSGVKM